MDTERPLVLLRPAARVTRAALPSLRSSRARSHLRKSVPAPKRSSASSTKPASAHSCWRSPTGGRSR